MTGVILSNLMTAGAKAGGWCIGMATDCIGSGEPCSGCDTRFVSSEVVMLHHESRIVLCMTCASDLGMVLTAGG